MNIVRVFGWGGGFVKRESFHEPAKRAERVLAPGDGDAEPGVTASNFREPAKLATDETRGSPNCFLYVSRVAHFVGSGPLEFGSPGSASPSPGLGLSPPASQAG